MQLPLRACLNVPTGYSPRAHVKDHAQWRNDGVAAASRDGGPHLQGGPRQFQVFND